MPQPTSLRVLLVEDDQDYAALLMADVLATSPAVGLDHVATLAAAERSVRATKYDAILLDLELPDTSGMATVERALVAADGVPVVVLTSHDDDVDANHAVQLGAQDYLVKGHADSRLLLRSIRYALERAEWRRELLDREAELRQAQKMEAVGRLAGGVAHDFNNVLTAIFGYADLLLDQFSEDDPRRADLQEIRLSAERAAALTRQLLAFSRKQVMQPRILNLNEVIAGLLKLLERLVGEDVTIEVNAASDLWAVRADAGQIEQVLMNLAANARDAMPEGGDLLIETANVLLEESEPRDRPGLPAGSYATLTVCDTGEGIPSSVRAHIFEPFFTTKGQGKGTGLGLATVYGIIKQMGGWVYVDSVETRGTRFVVYLPRVP